MVSTRNHPRNFPAADLSPGKSVVKRTPSPAPSSPTKKTMTKASSKTVATRDRARSISAWSHTTDALTLLWLFISLPLVVWDCGYVLGRPYTLSGGKWHDPVWSLYKIYAKVDLLYGWEAVHRNDGFTGAQGLLNVIETALYAWYLYIVFTAGRTNSGATGIKTALSSRKVFGRSAGLACIVGFTAAVMTCSKTVLYGAVGYYSAWADLKHNNPIDLFMVFIVPFSAWTGLSAYMAYVWGGEMLNGLEQAAGLPQKLE